MKSKQPKTNTSRKTGTKKSKPKSVSSRSSTTVNGNVNGAMLAGNFQGSTKLDSRKIKAQNYIEGGEGNLITVGASFKDIGELFATLNQRADKIKSPEERDEAKNAISKLEVEVNKGDKADEGKVQRWMNFLADIAPDIWEVAVDTFSNPIKGVSTVFRKVAERAKVEKSKK